MTTTITVRKLQDAFRTMDRSQNRNPRMSDSWEETECVYTQAETGEHCIAGQALAHMGVPLPEIGTFANDNNVRALFRRGRGNDQPTFFEGVGVTITDRALEVLDAVQTHADRGESWEHALSTIKGARR